MCTNDDQVSWSAVLEAAHPFIHTYIHSYIYTFIHTYIHSFIPLGVWERIQLLHYPNNLVRLTGWMRAVQRRLASISKYDSFVDSPGEKRQNHVQQYIHMYVQYMYM